MNGTAREDHGEVALAPVPAGTPRWISPELLAQTISTWQPYYQEPLTPEDAVAIIKSVGCLVDVLRGT